MPHARRPSIARVALTLGVIAALSPYALAAPGDPFSAALPGRDTTPPEGVSSAAAATDVGPQGSASYSYPITVPPGRNGMAPRLALHYSSNGALRGGLAVGWSLSLPSIERDPILPDNYRYAGELIVPMTGDLGTGTVWRLLVDRGQMLRIEKTPSSWIARTPDGITRVFAGDGLSVWNLVSEKDSFGNTVTYNWNPVATPDGHIEFVLQGIYYGANTNASVTDHAQVTFSWSTSTCEYALSPIGARTDGHFGLSRMFGSRRLSSITTSVRDVPGGFWRTVRRYQLNYDATETGCTNDRPPLNYLTEIIETGDPDSNFMKSAPPVRFTYGPKVRALTATLYPVDPGLAERGTDKGPDTQFMDFDGDGITDQIRVASPVDGRLVLAAARRDDRARA